MPSLGFAEILIILVFALIVFGPKRLPEMGRTIGRSLREFRRTSSEIRAELDLDDEPPRVPHPGARRAGEAAAEEDMPAPSASAEDREPPPLAGQEPPPPHDGHG